MNELRRPLLNAGTASWLASTMNTNPNAENQQAKTKGEKHRGEQKKDGRSSSIGSLASLQGGGQGENGGGDGWKGGARKPWKESTKREMQVSHRDKFSK